MSWDELKLFAADPLVTIGANAVTHCNLARRTEEIAGAEISLSRARTENRLQSPVAHLAYPHGNKLAAGRREFALARGAGFKTAVTTRPAVIFSQTADHLTALPRVSLNGDYQDARILPLLTSGRGHRDVEWFTPRRRGVEITTNRCLWPRCSRKRRWCGHP